jgi:hypothetical protein
VRPLLVATALLAAVASAHAASGWSVSGDLEHFRWEESGTPSVTETGTRYGFGWNWVQERPAGWQFAYRGQFRYGTLNYNGAFLFSGAPTTARTRYSDLVNEAQGIYRFGHPIGFELVTGIGLDWWRRKILPDQREDYYVGFLRLGVNVDPRARSGFFGGGGLKYPFYVSENAHLNDLGFDQNPRLEPKGEVSLYGQLGYRFTPRWSLIGYYDSLRLGQSKTVRATASDTPGTTFFLFQPASTINAYGLRLQYSFQ